MLSCGMSVCMGGTQVKPWRSKVSTGIRRTQHVDEMLLRMPWLDTAAWGALATMLFFRGCAIGSTGQDSPNRAPGVPE